MSRLDLLSPVTSLLQDNSAMWPDKVFVIAELSCNHCGHYDEALRLVDAAFNAGADGIKVQLYRPDGMTIDSDKFLITDGQWAGKTLYDLYTEAQTPWEWAPSLQEKANELGLKFVVSVYDQSGLDFVLKNLDPYSLKIASFELPDAHLRRLIARTGKRTIISTGMASEQEVLDAVNQWGNTDNLAVLHCISAYPTPIDAMHLATIREWARWGWRVGLSDHSLSTTVPALAVAAGATIIEKHFTMSRANGSQDAAFSLEPREFAQMVQNVREAEIIMGNTGRAKEEALYSQYRRSVYAVADIAEGELFTPQNTRTLRGPGGIHDVESVWGRIAQRAITRGESITSADLHHAG